MIFYSFRSLVIAYAILIAVVLLLAASRQTDRGTQETMRRAVEITKATCRVLRSEEPTLFSAALEEVQRGGSDRHC